MRQLSVENELRDIVSKLITQVELAAKQGRTDINLALEDAFIPILKSTHNLPNLINLNRKEKNYPAIDLGDDHDRVAFQITSTTSIEKVKKTIRKFVERKYYNSFDELFILTLVKKQSSYSQASINKLLDDNFVFDCKKHIIDLSDILGIVSGLRLPAQERILHEFKIILGEVDAYLDLTEDTIPDSLKLTSNLSEIIIPKKTYVAELRLDKKEILQQAKDILDYKGKTLSKSGSIKMALLLNDEETDSWVLYENKIFSFENLDEGAFSSIIDGGSFEEFNTSDLLNSNEIDNVNIVKQLLLSKAKQQLKELNVKFSMKEKCFYFLPNKEDDIIRKEDWVGKKKATRSVFEKRMQTKDPSKVNHFKHLSFTLNFMGIDSKWFCYVVPNWLFTYNCYSKSNYNDKLLSQQKRLEHNQSVRNQVRFLAYFLNQNSNKKDWELKFGEIIEFDTAEDDLSKEIPVEEIAA